MPGAVIYIKDGQNVTSTSVNIDGCGVHICHTQNPDSRIKFCPFCGADLNAPILIGRKKVPNAKDTEGTFDDEWAYHP